ncbi:5'/3'-nucleotidase SurE [Jiangella aurantiaca]|uniref:5'-nucleotidase n=1 Tax=Jiangella aurantiaca TaxID=2530373 RepID=A0A4R5A8F6_9ACTN|nr:5'/3'-nucleotidase SurE [Jiangella aurantiaca]TDD67386.1 5'/3'-nucleotidase SurE [Jiangella aurantiaca]
MNGRKRALVTNDDGIDAPGLRALAAAVRQLGHEVVVAAPAVQSSGSSASIIAGMADRDHIALERRRLEGLDGVPAYAVGGAPGLIALIAAYGAFGDPPDVVLSGVNHGANVGRAILHSGTVGAALTAGINGRRGLAVSLDVGLAVEYHLEAPATEPHWGTAADLAARVVPFLLDQRPGTILNLNVPDLEADELPGLRVAPLAEFGIVQTTMTEQTAEHIRLSVTDLSEPPGAGTDAALLAEGHPVITSVRSVCETDVPALDELVDAAVATGSE